ncbi:apolipoprotein L2-like isoform X1 [Canis lupus dingo]|uniref:apolipoprotein L2-like isoform X1 n=1 Tax=Canis lupus dingo TaxID=286419 RepID=UPI000DC68D30|nr:apolipoprotein L2-like isoform X1 [Canis lupus dingo]XP_025316892.1 apolipoprotein L2-like isoform X1 [Canis lupus dingo]XP_025316895.1 apolipoprotein L2-like isoform X1 [Canis lupus dingo]XP_025316903.1 apolipoprotein L2-like isoform X1 [Canis lupus dingo]XP_025316913.1 apolipoprotein L2-like isoform X1 [Canis lupus dingo]XP_025316923.1 apolipoprotein L2-like isoform X1 [Canis lupus dingo]XP_025316943.1 apolipoprotein L2-like isoform X1 [Canis lupus dingo]XP_025316952.1 apolipoprotein L2
MTSEGRELSPENESFLEDAIAYFQNTVSPEVLHHLLNDHEAWERFVAVAVASLPREEADILREGLNDLTGHMDMEDEDLARETFLNVFPQLKVELEKRIRKLRRLADEVDKVHKRCTISNMVASSTGAASGLLGVLGLGLAPVTAGFSLTLLTTGSMLGVAATVTHMSTSLVEYSNTSSARAEASDLVSGIDQGDRVGLDLQNTILKILSLGSVIRNLKKIAKNNSAKKVATVQPHLVDKARRLMTGRSVSVRSGNLVQKAFGGTALAMTKGIRFLGMASSGVFLLMDVASLVKESRHLHEGARAELAEVLRQQAQELERKLELLTRLYESLM